MNADAPDEISLKLLDELTRGSVISQRALADNLGIALGLVNAYIKRLYSKGYIKIKNLPRNRIKYIITPKGFAEKAKLTYNYLHHSINYFKDARKKIEHAYAVMLASGVRNVLLWGDGEIAELCYISARGLPINIVGVIGEKNIENGFFGHHVYSEDAARSIEYDAVLVSSLDMRDKIMKATDHNINAKDIYYLQ
jgi:DNA-binding MarR family transcriptional regulator